MNIDTIRQLRKTENLHIVLWLIKDTCWVLDFKPGGMLLILPTLLVAIYITWKWRMFKAELFHNIAVCFWISANITWMIGEFYFNDTSRPVAITFFALGIMTIAYYYIVSVHFKKAKQTTE